MALHLKIPPAVVMLVCSLLMWGLDRLVAINWGTVEVRWWGFCIFFALGAGIGLAGVVAFYRRSTTVDPHQPEKVTTFVQSGVYRLSRNPMYLGLLLILISCAVYLGNPISLVLFFVFVGYMNRFQIKPEELAMRQKFGNKYRDYCNKVRRWI